MQKSQKREQGSNIRATVAMFLIGLLVSPSIAHAAPAQNQAAPAEVRQLELNKPIEREMKGGESHTYEITLEANQYLNVVVEQKGIDVVVQVIAPDGKQIMEVDSPNGTQGPEPVSLITETSGRYQLKISSQDNKASQGRYEIRLLALRMPTASDRAAVEKERLTQEAKQLLAQAGSLYRAGKYDEAMPLAERVLAITENLPGAEQVYAIPSLTMLALIYRNKNDYAKAEPLLVRALTSTEKAYGENHPDVIFLLNNLAELYLATRDYAKAEPVYQRALATTEKVFGKEHPNTATALATLAALYVSTGDFTKAESLMLRALAIRKKLLGDENPATALSLNNLAELYETTGDYAKAEPLLVQAIPIFEKVYDKEHPDTATALNNLATLYTSTGDYTKAEPLYLRALAIREKVLGAEHPSTAISLDTLAALYKIKGEYAKAEALFLRALAIFEKVYGTEHLDTATAVNNLATLYIATGEFAKAEPLYLRALAIIEKLHGAEHPDTAKALDNLADLYKTKGDYARAEPLIVRALRINEKVLGAEHPATAISLSNLAELYKIKGDYARAEPLYLRALEIREKALGAEHPDTASAASNLAALYAAIGNYDRAEPLYLRALAISEKVFGKEHPITATALDNLAGLYKTTGDYTKAESLMVRALAIREQVLGKEHLGTAMSLDNLGELYSSKGDYARAEPLIVRALAIREKVLGVAHPDTAASLDSLAAIYYSEREYAKAESLLIRALAIREKALGAEHPATAIAVNDLAVLYDSTGNYAKAEPLYQRALAIREKALGLEHPATATSLNNLAILYYSKGEYAKAEPLMVQALAIFEKTLGKEHPETATLLNNLAGLYLETGNFTQAVALQNRCNEVAERDFTRNLASGSEHQRLLYLNRTSFFLDLTLSLHSLYAPNDLQAQRMALRILLQRKGRALDATTDAIAALRRRASPDDQKLLDHLTTARSQLSDATLKGAGAEGSAKHQENLASLSEQVEKLEAELSRRSADFRAQAVPVTLAAVQAAVPKDAALIEFASYQLCDAKTRKFGARRYVAYLLTNSGDIKWADLGEATKIDNAVKAFRTALHQKADGSLSDITGEVMPKARALDELIMRPLRALVGDNKRLLISPDGSLNLIPFDALVDEKNHYLVESYSISYLTSGRDLLRLQAEKSSNKTALVFANPDFDNGTAPVKTTSSDSRIAQRVDPTQQNNEHPTQRIGVRPGPKLGDAQLQPLERLPGSAVEGSELKKLLPDATVMTGAQATETALKRAASPSILHISTHGGFMEDESQPEPNATRGLLLRPAGANGFNERLTSKVKVEVRSGLFFAGANRGKSGDDDGVLTALEAASLDLYGTKLVVLSACDTGVGEVKNGDGVYGLRRALVLAGSETQVMSLWSVSDEGTRELMVEYYKRLLKGEGRGEALRQVRLQMLASKKLQHPYYWASFIQSGEWANLDGRR